MEGRLSKPINGKIQSFPVNTWEKEFHIASEIGYQLIEWVLDDNTKENPIVNKNQFKKVKNLNYK